MTPPAEAGVARPEVVTEEVATGRPGWIALATSADHKAVGRMYIATALTFLAAAITLLALMRIQLIVPDSTIIRPEIFNRLLSAYGVTGVLLFAVPLFMGLISYVVPLQIGARSVALPRLNALSYWLYVLGGVTIYASFLYRPSEAGTLALPPLSDQVFSINNGVDAWAAGVGLVVLGFVCFAVNMVTTVRNNRAPGMVWRRVPLFSFAATVISYTLLVIGPVMIAAVSMLLIDRNFDGVFFEAGEGGAPLLYAHLAWIFFTGIYVIVVLGAFGAISEIFSTFSRQPQFGQRAVEGSMVAFAILGVLAWMQNMYSAPIAIGFLYFAMAMAIALAIPVGLIIFNWIATLRGGSSEQRPPLRFAVAAAVLLIAGLAGEWAGSVIPVNWQIANTGVAWGDTHLALIGAGVLGGFAALHYWFPKITGRYMGRSLATGSLWLSLIGTVLMVIPIQLAGLEGMPVDVYEYFSDTGMSFYNLLGSIGAFALVGGIALTMINAAASYNRGAKAGPDPWGGTTLEWFALSPPAPHNFDLVPDVRSNEPFRDIREAVRRRSTELVLPAAKAAAEQPEPAGVGAEPAEEEPSAAGDEEAGDGDGPVA
jgi:heme/copper-type cytochrome/quinol oxidase subunit 1